MSFIPTATAGNLTFRAMGPDGKPLLFQSIHSNNSFYICDLDYISVTNWIPVKDIQEIRDLPDKPLLFSTTLKVPGFGLLDFTAANGGDGYLPDGQTLDMAYEVARHRYLAANKLMQQHSEKGFVFSDEIQSEMQRASKLLDAAAASMPGSKEQAQLSLKSLTKSAPVSEKIVVSIGTQKLDRQGGLRPSQWISTFGFYEEREGQRFRDTIDPVFNAVAQNWHWQEIMQPDGKGGWTYKWYNEDSVKRLLTMNKQIRSVTGMWMNRVPSWHPAFTVENFDQIGRIQADFARNIAEHYPQVRNFQIASEMNGSWDNLRVFGPEKIVEMVRAVSLATGQIRPDAVRAVNTNLIFGEDAAWHVGKVPRIVSGYEFYQMLNDKKVPYEAIVLQVYHNSRDIFEIEQRIEQFRVFGKSIQLELAAFSKDTPMPQCRHFPQGHPRQTKSVWHRDWDEALQADWLEQMFIVCMSKDYVEEFCWWDAADYDDSYFPWGGLVDDNYKPKESYKRLNLLVKRWGKNLNGIGKTYSEIIDCEK